jgi:hypothetical protein
VTAPATWGELAFMREPFPGLIAGAPGVPSFRGATCSAEESPHQPEPEGADGYVLCVEDDERSYALVHFTTGEALEAFTTEGVEDRGWSDRQWHYAATPDDPAGTEYLGPPGETGMHVTSFTREDRAQFLMIVWWDGHTATQIQEDWWQQAPF